MWILTPTSFVSLVAHRTKPGVILARARLPGDLGEMFPGCKVRRTDNADYRYRAEVSREDVRRCVDAELQCLDYTNVKGAIPKKGRTHQLRAAMMGRMWQAGMDAQIANARKVPLAADEAE